MAHKPYGSNKGAPPLKRKAPLPLFLFGGALALIIVGAFLLLRAPGAASTPVPAAGNPRLAVDREQIDFGKVPLDIPVRAEFQLTNAGDAPLVLAGVPAVEVREGC